MHPLDLVVLCVYLAIMVAFGARFSSQQRNVQDYFLSRKKVPWWALLGSIVATETSTVTLISVPGYAFGGDLTFLQLAFGYILGRIVVASLLIPRLFSGNLMTAYQPLAIRFGSDLARLSASIFLLTRSASDGFRLFATGLVLAAFLSTLPANGIMSPGVFLGSDGVTGLLALSIGLVGVTTLAYTLLGGMAAVIWSDVIQLVVYTLGAGIAGFIVLTEIPGGWGEVLALTQSAGKLTIFNFAFDLTESYTFWSGLVGGMFLTAGTHGTDQMFVQRYLCGRSSHDARRALVWSGAVIFFQFTLFLTIGLMLWVYYTTYAQESLSIITVDGVVQTDRIFPLFMMTHLPLGIRGLVVASIVAAAMSTLSSSLNSSAASTVGDFYIPLTSATRSDQHYLSASRWATVVWAIVQIAVALIAVAFSKRVVDEVLGIQSFTGGLLLGVFLLALSPVRRSAAPMIGMVVGTAVLVALKLLTSVSWQWYVLVGAVTTFGIGWLLGHLASNTQSKTDSTTS